MRDSLNLTYPVLHSGQRKEGGSSGGCGLEKVFVVYKRRYLLTLSYGIEKGLFVIGLTRDKRTRVGPYVFPDESTRSGEG